MMRTVVLPPPGILGLGRSRTVSLVGHVMTDAEADAVVDQLHRLGIPVAMTQDRDCTVHLRARGPVTTAQEVRAIRIVAAVTDAPLRWHPAVTS